MSRTSVNSSCKVKSPLSGFVTTAIILVSIYKLVGLLYWIPKAALAAIIICAVWPLIYPPSTFYRFWKTSLADFITSMLAFWITLFYSTEFGIFIPVAFNSKLCSSLPKRWSKTECLIFPFRSSAVHSASSGIMQDTSQSEAARLTLIAFLSITYRDREPTTN